MRFFDSILVGREAHAEADLIGGRKVRGNFHLGNLSCGGPLSTTKEGNDKSNTAQLFGTVTEDRMENSSFAVPPFYWAAFAPSAPQGSICFNFLFCKAL